MTILIVEDNKDIVSIYKNELEFHGYQVETAFDGQEAIDKLLEKKFDLILLDINLPKVDGITVLSNLRQNDKNSSTHVLVLTNVDASIEIKEAYRHSIDGYLIKSEILPDDLMSEIDRILGINQ